MPLLGAKITDEEDVWEKGIRHAIRVDDVMGQAIVMCAQVRKVSMRCIGAAARSHMRIERSKMVVYGETAACVDVWVFR